jgi:hypothetical protein
VVLRNLAIASGLEEKGDEARRPLRREVLLRRQDSISCSLGEAPSSSAMVAVVGWVVLMVWTWSI